MNKLTLTLVAAMLSVNAFAATGPVTPGFGQKDEPAKNSHKTECPFAKPSKSRHQVVKIKKAAVTTVVASNDLKAADSNAGTKVKK
jgi:hypothetical protein